jgi:hypothetical protein
MDNFYDLDIKCQPLREDFILPEFSYKRKVIQYSPKILSIKFNDWCNSVGLFPEKVLIFIDPGDNNKRRIHIDGLGNTAKLFSINWNLGCDDVIMEWFKVCGSPKIAFSPYPYMLYSEDDCELVESSRSLGPVLFNTSVPHSVMNVTGSRYGLTVRFSNKIDFASAKQMILMHTRASPINMGC